MGEQVDKADHGDLVWKSLSQISGQQEKEVAHLHAFAGMIGPMKNYKLIIDPSLLESRKT